jgi:CheY-like chemotaxis protein
MRAYLQPVHSGHGEDAADERKSMTHNVLVVDDEPKLCDLLSSALGQNGIQVFTAGNGLHALKVLEQEDIDLVISDWRMPGMDGPALLAEIKVRFPATAGDRDDRLQHGKNAVQSMPQRGLRLHRQAVRYRRAGHHRGQGPAISRHHARQRAHACRTR